MVKLIITLLLLPILANATEGLEKHKDELRWGFSDFVQSLQSKNWDQISKFETKVTKCGFGPDEEGLGCIRKAIHIDKQCADKMLFVLKLGCKIEKTHEYLSCASPPQWLDESIITLGARASFSFNLKSKSVVVNHFICGGD